MMLFFYSHCMCEQFCYKPFVALRELRLAVIIRRSILVIIEDSCSGRMYKPFYGSYVSLQYRLSCVALLHWLS